MVAKTVIGTKEKLLTLIPTDDGILTLTLPKKEKQQPEAKRIEIK